MTIEEFAEKIMGMSDAVWERHANPWSGWTRIAILPLFALAIWSRVWIGQWAWAAVAAVLIWVWLNPRAFPPPAKTTSWMSRGVMGERVFLNRKNVPIPANIVRRGNLLNAISALGIVPFVYGLVVLDLPATLIGMSITIAAKLAYIDVTARLYDRMRKVHPPYDAWMRE